jgi:RNA-directed DNA polymerase
MSSWDSSAMGFWDWFKRKMPDAGGGLGVEWLARRLAMSEDELRGLRPAYREHTIPKRSGGTRTILAPEPALKVVQRRILHRLLRRLKSHPSAVGFERGHSIVSHAAHHRGQAVVVRMDIENFFDSTPATRVLAYFRRIGWNREAADLLTTLCTWKGRLPQGAPTSPRLSNLVNYRLDARLAAMVERAKISYQNPKTLSREQSFELGRDVLVRYSRYADDLTFSFDRDHHNAIQAVIWMTKKIVKDEGYRLHVKKKLRIMRRHDRQLVTGLVVNDRVNLPRTTRRWLRAVEHHARTGRPATLTPAQLDGWRALRWMIDHQSANDTDAGS